MRMFQLRRQAPAMQLLFFLCLYFLGTALFMGSSQALTSMMHIDLKSLNSTAPQVNSNLSWGLLLLNGLSQVLTFLVPSLAFIYLLPDRPRFFLSFKPVKGSHVAGIFLVAIGMLALILGLSALLQSFSWGTEADTMQEQRKAMEAALLHMDTAGDILIRLVFIALIPAFCEEIFFRGIVQRFFNSFLKRPVLSIIATGLFFAMYHASIYNFLPITLAGIVLGLIYHRTGNIWYAILLHFLNNGIQVLQAFWVSRNPQLEEEQLPVYLIIGLLAAGAVIVFFTLRRIFAGTHGFAKTWSMPHQSPYQNNISE
ncbi:CAAX amino terminal protease self- immunity [compost metagenome]